MARRRDRPGCRLRPWALARRGGQAPKDRKSGRSGYLAEQRPVRQPPGSHLPERSNRGVADRVEIKSGDARQLPFEDDTFDVVVSSLVLHNIHDASERKKAIREIARVLKGGGHVAILDVWYTNKYEQELRKSGMQELSRSGLRFSMGVPLRVVSGSKPAS
jgi:SAM-dependent methyltransferase